jgi:hypothetical protein
MKPKQLAERALLRPLSSSQSVVFAAIVTLTFGISFGASAHEKTDLSAAPAMMPQTAAKVPPGQAAKLQGVLTIIHADYFPQNQSAQALVIHEDNGNDTRVNFNGSQPKLGSRLSVSGTVAADGSVNVSGTTVLGESTATTLASGSVTQNAIFILVKFLDSGASDPFTQSQVQAVAQTNANSVQAFYSEVSYGHQALNITVTPWLTASMNTSTNCDYTSIGNAANSAATAAGYNLSNYVNKYYVMPHNASCGWAGLAYVGSPYTAWSNGYNSGQVYTHELGHNFGLLHAGSVSCLGAGCGVAEYGDGYDTMGNSAMMHYNSFQKSRLGWLPGYTSHTGGTATYNLTPLEMVGGGNYAVRIAAASNRIYWIEYRQPTGLFDNVSGVQFRVASPFESSSGSDDTEIFDSGFGVSGLPVGNTFTDSTYGISVTVTSATPSGASVQVTSSGSSVTSSSTAVTSSLNPSPVGNMVSFTARVTGSSPTGTVTINVDGGALCTATLSSGSAACSTSGLSAGSHNVVASYNGDSKNSASTSPMLSESVTSTPDSTPPVVTLTSPANGTKLSGAMVTVSANATDNVGVKSMTLYIDNSVVATTNLGSISYKWQTKKVASGPHTIYAKASDAAGNVATSTTITVTK